MLRLVCLIVVLSASGCMAPEQEGGLDDRTDLPEHLQEYENLTVHPPLVDREPKYEVRLDYDQVFGEEDEVLIGRISGVEVDDEGRVYIVDGSRMTIHVFDEDGNYLTSLGRSGQGPGEFSAMQLKTPVFRDGTQLYVYDSGLRRMNIYSFESLSSSGTIVFNQESLTHVDIQLGFPPYPVSIRRDGNFVIAFQEGYFHQSPGRVDSNRTMYYLMDESGQILHSKGVLFTTYVKPLVEIRQNFSSPHYFSRRTLMDISDDDHIYSAWSEEFLVEKYDPEGNYIQAFYYPYTNREVSRQDVNERISDRFSESLRNSDSLPDTWPALYALFVDDENRIWVSTNSDNEDLRNWWILSDKGELLGHIEYPSGETTYLGEVQIQIVKDGYLYKRENDEETGSEKVVRYRIEMEEG